MADETQLRKQLGLLMTAYGYNLYNSENRARADDLLVRQKACALLGDGVGRLTQLAADYTRRCIPASTRDQPFPPAEKIARLREIEELRGQMDTLASRIRGMAVPTQDRTWARFREEASTLQALLGYDYRLISEANAVYQFLEPLTAEAWEGASTAELRSLLHTLETTAREREQFLVQPY